MNRIVVTGASGFIGRILCPLLRERGHEVVALDRAAVGDIAAISDWPACIAGAQAVVHLAALAHARGVDAAQLRRVNVEASVALGRAAAAAGARMLFMSSVKVHGEETAAAPFNESSPLAPQDAYAHVKAEAETKLRAIQGLLLTVLRPPLVYGPGVKANFLALMRAIARGWPLPLAGLDNRRSLLYAGNLADAVLRCLDAPPGKTFLVADGAAVSTTELCERIAVALGKRARLFGLPRVLLEIAPPALTRSLVVDDGAIRRELGWSPPYSFDEGLRRTAEWLKGRGG
jgi:nucleoside-diphosphate-sugar epimerase